MRPSTSSGGKVTGRIIKGVREVSCLSTAERGARRKLSYRILYTSSTGSGSGWGLDSGVCFSSTPDSVDADVDKDKSGSLEGDLRRSASVPQISALITLCFLRTAAARFFITSTGKRGILNL